MLSGYRPFPDGFVAAVVRNGQLERIAPALRGAGVVEGVGDGSLHRIAFEQDPFPVERGRITAYAGEVVPQAEGDAACSDRLFGFEARLDLWRNGVGYHAEVAQCAGREGDGAVFYIFLRRKRPSLCGRIPRWCGVVSSEEHMPGS